MIYGELKGYGIYINQSGALYDGFQNTDGVCVPLTLTSIAITTPANKLSYIVGNTLDLTGLVVTGTYSDGSTRVETVTVDNVSGFNSSTPIIGQVLTITFGDKAAAYTVDIAAIPTPTFSATGDTSTNKYDQAFLGPVSQAITGTIKVTAGNEDQRLRDVVLTGVTSAGNIDDYVSSVALYDGTTQIANFITPVGNTATFMSADMIVPTTFIKNTPKVLNIVANIKSLPVEGTTLYWTIEAWANQFRTTGLTSGVVASNPLTLTDLRTNVGAYNEGGLYTMRSNVLEMSKSADSPSGTLARGTFVTVAKYDLNSKGAGQNLGLAAVTFTSTVGFPAALTSSVAGGAINDAALFRIYDVDNGIAIPATKFLNTANNTITFSDIDSVGFPPVIYGQTRHLALQVTTTNHALWPAGTSLVGTIQKTNDVIVPAAGVGFGGAVYSIPATANTVTIGS